MVQLKSELQNAADAAALAAASAMSAKGISEDEAKDLAKKFLAGQMANQLAELALTDPEAQARLEALKDDTGVLAQETAGKGKAKTFDITVNAKYQLKMNAMTRLLGYDTMEINVASSSQSATESKNALSMFLVLDRSGSMGEDTDTVNAAQPTKNQSYTCGRSTCYREVTNYVLKIDALKSAVAGLTAQLDTADPDKQYVRTAAISYNSAKQSPTSFEWGTAKALTYVNALIASGGTASTQAFKTAYQELSPNTEDNAHKAKNGQIPTKYIVLMTDGDNNNSSDDTATLKWCDAAKAEKMEIFTVAFMAPTRGQNLLKACATSSTYYYDAKNATQLVAAFQAIGEKASLAATRLTN